MGRSTDKETEVERAEEVSDVDGEAEGRDRVGRVAWRPLGEGVCREHQISDTLFYSWRDKLIEGGLEALAGKEERQGERELRRRVAELERALGRKTSRARDRGRSLGGLGVSVRVARSRRLVAEGYALATVARVMQISRQALYRTPTPRRPPQRRPSMDPVEKAIVEEATANQTDGYRMVCAFVRQRLGIAVNRKRVLRERKLIQRRRPLERRKRPASSGSSGPGSCGSST